MTLSAIQAAALRARELMTGLEQSDRQSDRHQVAAGVRHELDTMLSLLHSELQRRGEAAAGDRPGKVRADASGPSRRAARAITLKTGSARVKILQALWAHQDATDPTWATRQGLTDLDLQNRLNLNPSTERPRRGELVEGGLVEVVGERGQAGSDWTVWGITQAGADILRSIDGTPERTVIQSGQPMLF